MRRFLFLALFLVPYFCGAQLFIGVKAGYSPLTKISFKPSLKATNFPAEIPDYGFILKYYNDKWAGVQAEINLTQRGYNTPYKETFQYRRVNRYVEMPLIFQIHLNISGLYVHGGAGCYAAYLLSAKHGYDTTGTMVLNDYTFNILRDHRFDYGLIGGAGLSYEFNWGVIQVEARIMYGYADLLKYDYPGNPEQSKAVVQNINFSYMYNISKIGKKKKPIGNQ